jgi:hypothetical protein
MTHDIIREPCGGDYSELILFCAGIASTGLVVVNDPATVSMTAKVFLSALTPHLLEVKASSEWPGTRLLERSAWIYSFHMNRDITALLLRSAERLYAWLEPALPEDLCLMRNSGEPLLVTISHEHDAYLDLTDAEMSQLKGKISPQVLLQHPT